MKNIRPVVQLLQRYIERDPLAASKYLEAMDESEAVAAMAFLSPALCAEVIPHMRMNYVAEFFKQSSPEVFEVVVKRLRPEQAATLLRALPQDLCKALIDRLPEEMKKEVQDLLIFPENSAGRIMSTLFIAYHEDMIVKEAIQRIRATVSRYGPATYTYVVDHENHLCGVLNMRDLLLAPPDIPIRDVMDRNVFCIDGFMDREEVAEELSKQHFYAAPVVDAERHLLGVVRSDHLLGHVQEEGTEDILKMVGAGKDERTTSPISFAMGKRLPWLHVNLATAFLAASVVALFQDIIAKVTVLAVFLPIVAGQGGNAGAQSLAVVMRGIVMREIRPADRWRLVMKEARLGLLNGTVIGIVTAAVAWLWQGNPTLGLVIGLAMIVNLVAAGFCGAAIPLGMKALGWDPAQSSVIILTTVTDVVGFFAFLGFATVFMKHLI
ncbi:MAG: magnesium transporter [Elusimicrobia bacterium]|nr:magnesium transporter [Candidatus Obscuribacterium magneticum]